MKRESLTDGANDDTTQVQVQVQDRYNTRHGNKHNAESLPAMTLGPVVALMRFAVVCHRRLRDGSV